MVHFIHLSLLLATAIQLPLVSVALTLLDRVTVQFPQQWEVRRCINDNCTHGLGESCDNQISGVMNTCILEDLPALNHGSHRFYKASHKQKKNGKKCLYLQVTIGCIESDFCDIDNSQRRKRHSNNPIIPKMDTKAECRKLCTDDPTCKYFTFKKSNNKCSKYCLPSDKEIKLDEHTVSGCPLRNGYRNRNGLQFYQEAKSWIDAVKHCQNKNSSLVEITNKTVQTAVNFFFRNKTDEMPKGVWIGLQRSIFGKNVPWMWISGSEAVFSQWNSSIPVDRFNNHCGKIIWVEDSEEFEWLDGNCHDKLPFICQGWFNQSLHHNYTTDGNENPT